MKKDWSSGGISARGTARGLLLLWKEDINPQILEVTHNWILVIIYPKDGFVPWIWLPLCKVRLMYHSRKIFG